MKMTTIEMDPNKFYSILVDVKDLNLQKTIDFINKIKGVYESQNIKAVYSAVVDGTPILTINEIDRTTLPVNLNDKLYIINEGKVYPVYVTAIKIDNKKNGNRICVAGTFHYSDDYTHDYRATFPFESLGKTLFRSKEEAKANL